MSARVRIRSVGLWLAACMVVGAAGSFLVFGERAARPRSSTANAAPAAAPEPTAHSVRAEGRVATYPGATVDVGSEAGGRV